MRVWRRCVFNKNILSSLLSYEVKTQYLLSRYNRTKTTMCILQKVIEDAHAAYWEHGGLETPGRASCIPQYRLGIPLPKNYAAKAPSSQISL